MKRNALALLSSLLLAGCATTGSNYYGHEGSGDYYYGSPSADAYIGSPDHARPYWGSNGGYGYGFGYGYGHGGYGYGGYGYGYPYSWWGYGYPPIWWQPSLPHDQAGVLRGERVERDRASRSALIRRETVQAPAEATMFRAQPAYPQASMAPRVNADARMPRASSPRVMVAPQPVAPARSAAPVRSVAPVSRSSSTPMRSSSPPPPTRSAPTPRKQ